MSPQDRAGYVSRQEPLVDGATHRLARRGALGLLAAGLLAGCAGMNTLSSDVATYGEWPTGRKAGSYAFERLPSQQARANEQAMLEAAAVPALQAAGFTPVAAGAQPDVLVQVGVRITRNDATVWNDPLWWRGGVGLYRHGPWGGVRWNLMMQDDWTRIEREIALLIRDRATGKPLYEARATHGSASAGTAGGLRAMFAAALKDFPATGLNPRTVTVPLTD